MTATSPTRVVTTAINSLWVLLSGLGTTAAALFAVYLYTEHFHEDAMAVYFFYIIPVGAIIIGLVSGIGYLVAILYTGVRLRAWALCLIAALQVLAYFLAQYLEFRAHHYVYRDTHQPASFWYYFHLRAMSYVFHSHTGHDLELGPVGYLLRGLEIGLFAACGLFLPATTTNKPYCRQCRAYLKHKELALIPAEELIPDTDADRGPELEQTINDAGAAAFDALATIAESGDIDGFRAQIKPYPPPRLKRELPSRLEVALTYCPICRDGKLYGTTTIVRSISRKLDRPPGRAVSPEFIAAIT